MTSKVKKTFSFKRVSMNYLTSIFCYSLYDIILTKGHVFDLVHIVPYMKKYKANPCTGEPLDSKGSI